MIQVGLGGWGQDWHRNVLQPCAEIELAAVVEQDPATMALARQRLGLAPERCFASLAEALQAVAADAVLVTAWLGAHIPVALAALAAGKHVLVEKPFAASAAEARQAVEAAEQRGLVLMVSQNYRFYPAVRAAAALLREELLGPVSAVQIDFRRFANGSPSPANRHHRLAQPLLLDMAIHHFDLMRLLLGREPAQVFCQTWNPPWSNFVEPPAGAATVSFEGGAVVSYSGSWVSTGAATPWAGAWRIECERGELALTSRADGGSLRGERLTVRPLGKAARRVELPALAQIDRAGALAAFVRAVAQGAEPECSGRDNLGTLALMRAAIDSANTGAPQRVERG